MAGRIVVRITCHPHKRNQGVRCFCRDRCTRHTSAADFKLGPISARVLVAGALSQMFEETVSLGSSNGKTIAGMLHHPAGELPRGAIILCHGMESSKNKIGRAS